MYPTIRAQGHKGDLNTSTFRMGPLLKLQGYGWSRGREVLMWGLVWWRYHWRKKMVWNVTAHERKRGQLKLLKSYPKVQIRPGLLAKHSPPLSCMAGEMDVMFKTTRPCHSNYWNLCQAWPLQFDLPQFFRSQLFWESNHRHAGEKDEDDKPLKFGRPWKLEGTDNFWQLGVTFSSIKERGFC